MLPRPYPILPFANPADPPATVCGAAIDGALRGVSGLVAGSAVGAAVPVVLAKMLAQQMGSREAVSGPGLIDPPTDLAT